jgi:DNA-binding transcriptional regulator YdaS (Cro superfamily)
MTTNSIAQAVAIKGSNAALAAAIGVHESAISLWKTERRTVPAQYCIAIETATEGRVTRYALRPDVFGSAPDQAA